MSKDKNKRKRLSNIDVNELSMVDSPAIGENFIITKNVKGSLDVTKKVTLNKATSNWNDSVKKAVNSENKSCLFCGITKEEEEKSLGMGLLCSVCFDCAFKRMEKGVFDQCIEGIFDFEKFKIEFPDDEIFKSDEKDLDENKDEGKKEDEEKDDDKEEKDGDDETEEDGKKEDESEEESEEKNDDLKLEVDKLKNETKELSKNLNDVKDMLETSLMIHQQTAEGFNNIVGLTFMALDLITELMETESDEMAKSIKEFKELIKQEDVSKAGAKISSSRLQTLRDIAEKLTQLIESVSSDESKKESKKKSVQSIDELKNITQKNADVIKGMEEKITLLTKTVEALSLAGGISNALNDDEDENQTVEKLNDKVDFSDIVGLDDIKKRYEGKNKK